MAKKTRAETSDAVEILQRRFVDDKPGMERLVRIERTNARIARSIYQLRRRAGLTQKALASLIGTKPSVISRLEDADYDGHSISMLQRIAHALGREVEVKFKRPDRTVPTT